jgi:hypothetical protein
MRIDITDIMAALIAALLAAAASYAIPWLKAKTGCAQWENLREYARTAVMAAEQMYRKLSGPEKLKKATEAVDRLLRRHGISYDKEAVRCEIESAVLALKREALKREDDDDGD